MEVQIMEERWDIQNLLERSCWSIDHGQVEEWVNCFARDGVFVVRDEEIHGRAAIKEYVSGNIGQFALSRHMIYAPSIVITSADTAQARCYFRFQGRNVRGKDIEALGSYEDEVAKEEGGWRFARRVVTFAYFGGRDDPWATS
jgi:ketosteroid isomerase-like protein